MIVPGMSGEKYYWQGVLVPFDEKNRFIIPKNIATILGALAPGGSSGPASRSSTFHSGISLSREATTAPPAPPEIFMTNWIALKGTLYTYRPWPWFPENRLIEFHARVSIHSRWKGREFDLRARLLLENALPSNSDGFNLPKISLSKWCARQK